MASDSPPSITIEAFAFVQAAEQEAIPLEKALAEQGIERGVWSAQRPDVLAQITADAASFRHYQGALEQAQDALYRSVDPLYDDIVVWLAYSAAAEAEGMGSFLKRHGLTLGDFGRLERHWRGRYASEPELVKAAKKARAQPRPDPLPPVTIGARSPASAPRQEAAVTAPLPVSEDLFERIERVAWLTALLAADPRGDKLGARAGVSPDEARAEVRGLEIEVGEDPALRSHLRCRIEHFRRVALVTTPQAEGAARLASERSPAFAPLPAVRAPAPLDATGPVDILRLDAPTMPFDLAAPVVAPPLAAGEPDPFAQSADETAELDLGRLAVLVTPFDPRRSRPATDVGGKTADTTAEVTVDLLSAPPLPFVEGAPPRFPPRAAIDLRPPSEGSIDETAELDVAHLRELATPFDKPAPVEHEANPGPDQRPPRGAAAEPWEQSVDETAAIDLSLLGLWEPPTTSTPEGEPPSAARTIETDPSTYASYCVELELFPARAADVRARYQVTDELAHERLEGLWRSRQARDGALAARVAEARRRYRAWLLQQTPEDQT